MSNFCPGCEERIGYFDNTALSHGERWHRRCYQTALRAPKAVSDDQPLIDAANAALAHIEGRRGIFSTRDPRTVAIILRQALGAQVNEQRGTAWPE